jgi:hypothetical protein
MQLTFFKISPVETRCNTTAFSPTGLVHAALNRRLDRIPNFGGAIEPTRIDRGWPISIPKVCG